ncbi:MAG: aldose 1-epimerase family protein [Bacteroidota bacterium]
MPHILSNNLLAVGVHAQGAELCSLVRHTDSREYIWQAEPIVWARHAPVLFPIVGKLRNNAYEYYGKTWYLPQHGFARDMDFKIVTESADELVFELQQTEATLNFYPFLFRLQISYKLAGNRLAIKYTVINPDSEKPLYFGIGAHPGFAAPAHADESISDYYLEFEKPETLFRQNLEAGLRLPAETVPYLDNARVIALSDEIFKDDALVFAGHESAYVRLLNKRGDYSLKIEIKDFPYLGIWAKPGAPFVCVEPWYGIADTRNASPDYTVKEGNIKLEAGREWSAEFAITVE